MAVVVARFGQRPELDDVRQFCKQQLAPYKVPRRLVVMNELPVSILGKVLRKRVRDELSQR